MIKGLLQIFLFVFPWRIRRRLLCVLLGFDINGTAKIGYSLLLAKKVVMGPHAIIRNFNFCKRIDLLELNEGACIATGNILSGFSTDIPSEFSYNPDRRCELILGRNATITSRHFIDCNGGVYIGEFSTVAGNGSYILSHSINVYINRQTVKPIRIGKYCFVGARCIMVPGAELPDYSVLGAGAVLTKALKITGGLYVGSPATLKRSLSVNQCEYFNRVSRTVE